MTITIVIATVLAVFCTFMSALAYSQIATRGL